MLKYRNNKIFIKEPTMKVKMSHSSYMARKIAKDLSENKYVKILSGIEHMSGIAQTLIEADIQKEIDLENKINEMMDEQEENDEFEYVEVDYREVFWMVKRRLAKETGFELNYDDRYSDLAHRIVDDLWKQEAIEYDVSEGIVKNTVYDALFKYLNEFDNVEKEITEQMNSYKQKLIPGTEDYQVVYEKLYAAALQKHGLA